MLDFLSFGQLESKAPEQPAPKTNNDHNKQNKKTPTEVKSIIQSK